MKTLIRLIICVAVVLAIPPGTEAGATVQKFRVVVHESNPVNSMDRDQVSKLFMRQVTKWQQGDRARPVDLGQGSETRENFSRVVHQRSLEAVNWYWRRMQFNTGVGQPTEMTTDAQVMAFVSANPHAIGYVSTKTPMTGYRIKEIQISGVD